VKFQNPRCFKNIKTLYTKFTTNSKAWMTSNMFKNELLALDAKLGSKNQNILLFLDHFPGRVVDTVASFLGGPKLKSWPGDWLS
jgi:hypothetical protein